MATLHDNYLDILGSAKEQRRRQAIKVPCEPRNLAMPIYVRQGRGRYARVKDVALLHSADLPIIYLASLFTFCSQIVAICRDLYDTFMTLVVPAEVVACWNVPTVPEKRFDPHRIWHVRTNVLTSARKGHILLLRLLCDLNGMSTRTSKTFASTMLALKQRRSFSMIPTL